MSTVQGDPEAFMTLNLSRNLGQSMNPGYQLRDGFEQESCMKSDFIWDQDEVRKHAIALAFSSNNWNTSVLTVVWPHATVSVQSTQLPLTDHDPDVCLVSSWNSVNVRHLATEVLCNTD